VCVCDFTARPGWCAEEKKDVSGSYHESCNVGGLGFVLVIPPTGKITREKKGLVISWLGVGNEGYVGSLSLLFVVDRRSVSPIHFFSHNKRFWSEFSGNCWCEKFIPRNSSFFWALYGWKGGPAHRNQI
jgi:hypothetical protein